MDDAPHLDVHSVSEPDVFFAFPKPALSHLRAPGSPHCFRAPEPAPHLKLLLPRAPIPEFSDERGQVDQQHVPVPELLHGFPSPRLLHRHLQPPKLHCHWWPPELCAAVGL
ncbi:hypothetical protein GOODEAATRI_034060 [Goodea atripinnis]|uniref:Uncharacterized protein n=1 Tax=Goodea atripinnis TaxID=208336 RepID=A0ABV0PTW2_9TELE